MRECIEREPRKDNTYTEWFVALLLTRLCGKESFQLIRIAMHTHGEHIESLVFFDPMLIVVNVLRSEYIYHTMRFGHSCLRRVSCIGIIAK